jgi:AcrR family transcriptional regulator
VTEVAIRRAALRLMVERGYDATTADDIAREAGVSADTFYLYFPTKEMAVLFPDGLVVGLVLASLGPRPATEDPVVSLVAAVDATFEALDRLSRDDDVLRNGVRVMLREPRLHRVLVERRLGVENEMWAAMQRRGVPADDLAMQAATATVVTLGFLALQRWADSDGSEPLAAVLADCLLRTPNPSLLQRGLDARTAR